MLNMFQASLCPLSGAYQLQQQPLVYRRTVVVAVLLADHDQQHYYHNVPTVKPEAATAVDRLLMMGIRMPETC